MMRQNEKTGKKKRRISLSIICKTILTNENKTLNKNNYIPIMHKPGICGETEEKSRRQETSRQ